MSELFFHISRNDDFRDYSKAWQQEEFYDIALIGDDCERVSAHKLVLFLESEFCRKRLTKATTELCLQGVNSKDINNILEFIYNGKVDVRNDDLKEFLQIARKLELKDLRFPEEDSKEAFEATDEKTDALSQTESEKFTDHKVSSGQETRENKNVVDKVEVPPLNSKPVAAASEPKLKTCSTTKTEETDAKKS